MASSKSKSKIFEFNPSVYPTRIWVAKTKEVSIDELDAKFYALNDENERLGYKEATSELDANIYAVCHSVSDKESGWRGVLVLLNRKDMPLSTIAHESSHCTDWLFEQLGVESGTTFDNGEARAYYLEWVFNRIYEVWKGKVK